jgi:hypothetical protein
MAQEMYKHDALLHLVWCVATGDGAPGAEKNVTPEEDSYLDTVRKQEGIQIDWADFNAKRKSLDYSRTRIIDEACKALRGCGKDWKIKCIGYMQRMGWVSQEDDLNNNMSDKEWELVIRAQRELGLTDEERKNSYQNLPRK